MHFLGRINVSEALLSPKMLPELDLLLDVTCRLEGSFSPSSSGTLGVFSLGVKKQTPAFILLPLSFPIFRIHLP